MLLEDLQKDFQNTISNLLSFLEIKKIELKKIISNQAGLPIHLGINSYLLKPHNFLRNIFGFIPLNIRHKMKQTLIKGNIRKIKYPPIPEDFENELRYKFIDDIKSLEKVIGRNLSQWYPKK